jgi:hypothetical protein
MSNTSTTHSSTTFFLEHADDQAALRWASFVYESLGVDDGQSYEDLCDSYYRGAREAVTLLAKEKNGHALKQLVDKLDTRKLYADKVTS